MSTLKEVDMVTCCRRHHQEAMRRLVSMLIEPGADVNAPGGQYGNALQATSLEGHEKVVQTIQLRGAVATEPSGILDRA